MGKESKLREKIANDFWYGFQNTLQIISIYPEVQEIIINLTYNYDEYECSNQEETKIFTPDHKAFFKFECKNKDCIYGGFNISNEIFNLINSKQESQEGKLICNGYQDYESFVTKNYHCYCELDYKIVIKYKIENKGS